MLALYIPGICRFLVYGSHVPGICHTYYTIQIPDGCQEWAKQNDGTDAE